eukprot:gene2777-4185_t
MDTFKEIGRLLNSKEEKDTKMALELISISLNSEKTYDENLQKILEAIKLQQLFNTLETSNPQIVELSLSSLSKIFKKKNFTKNFLKDDGSKYLLYGMKHNNERVRSFLVGQIDCLSETEKDVEFLFSNQNLIDVITISMKDEDIDVFKVTQELLKKLSKSIFGLQSIFSNEDMLKAFSVKMDQNSIQRLRILETFILIGNLSEETFQFCENKGVFKDFIEDLNTKNVLTLLNLFEFLKLFAEKPYGIQYLESKRVVEDLIQKHFIESKDSDDLIISFLLRFISEIASKGTISILIPDKIFDKLLENLDSKDNRIKELSITVIGNLCSNSKDVLKLTSNSNLFQEYLYFINSSEVELRYSFYHSLAFIFESKVNSSESLLNFYENISQQILKFSGKSIIKHMMEMTEKPFVDHRTAAFHLIRSFCFHNWGVELLSKYPGFLKYLMDRNTEIDKDCKEWKFTIVERIMESYSKDKKILDKVHFM